jgi:site-specific recombinase XerD
MATSLLSDGCAGLCLEFRMLVAGPAWTESNLVFTTQKGIPIDPDNFAHYFRRLCARAGLGHWTLHELRHSAASIMLAQGTPLYVVSEVLGHASVAITKDVYGHLIGGEKQEATEAITDVLFGNTLPPGGRTSNHGA